MLFRSAANITGSGEVRVNVDALRGARAQRVHDPVGKERGPQPVPGADGGRLAGAHGVEEIGHEVAGADRMRVAGALDVAGLGAGDLHLLVVVVEDGGSDRKSTRLNSSHW